MRKRIALALALGLALTVSLSACEQKKSAKKANRVSTEQADEDDGEIAAKQARASATRLRTGRQRVRAR